MLLGEMECYKMEYYKMPVRLQERLKQILIGYEAQ
jgi:hypothetical protein